MSEILIIVLLAILLDHLIPDRQGIKPFAWYRDWAESIEERFNGGKRTHGIGAVMLATLPIVAGVMLIHYILGELGWILRVAFDVVVLYLCLDVHRLGKTANAISNALESGELGEADDKLRDLIGKGVPERTDANIARAAVEGVLKQGNSLIVSPIFWFILLGPFGAVLQRLSCILDSLWGHRYERFAEFGWAAARFDDLMGWVPARITALSYALMGSFEDALHCWRRRVGVWSDINSGPLLASGFGAMHMQICEAAEESEYEEKTSDLTVIPDAGHVQRAVALVWRMLLLWLVIGILMTGAHLIGFITA
ncbi:MAG: regulatory signaling modulator protein AmpE [Sulfuricaulis sp.]|uniref:cobalamin biosynthesis protein CobD/CbiB n=1 Tax=Sulfuricaulis sp. TaxID=2003553 RepID=UPI0025FEC298|nr:regulatory signaling modulator protein AmpE [Sulfuricaulis sp.]MCR4346812.1 regulatory signaling modulator protein AmpE [Sulfuricaulis sp.]